MNIYQLVILFLLSLYFLGILSFGIEKVAWQAVPVILATTLSGAIFDFLELKRWSKPITPFITGLIIGLVSSFGEQALILASLGVAAMFVKFIIKFDGRHIFNPAGGGLFLGLLFSSYPSWWVGGSNFWIYLIWIPILLLKFKRWTPILVFLLFQIILDGPQVLTSTSLLFFSSVMLIEPKTSPADLKNGLIYGFLVSISFLVLTKYPIIQDPLIASLLLGNLYARLKA